MNFSIFGKKLNKYQLDCLSKFSLIGQGDDYSFSNLAELRKCSSTELEGKVIVLDEKKGPRICGKQADGFLGSIQIERNKGITNFCDLIVTEGKLDVLIFDFDSSMTLFEPGECSFLPFHVGVSVPQYDRVDRISGVETKIFVDSYRSNSLEEFYTRRFELKPTDGLVRLLTAGHTFRSSAFEIDLTCLTCWYWHPWTKEHPYPLTTIGYSSNNNWQLALYKPSSYPIQYFVYDQTDDRIELVSTDFDQCLELFVLNSIQYGVE